MKSLSSSTFYVNLWILPGWFGKKCYNELGNAKMCSFFFFILIYNSFMHVWYFGFSFPVLVFVIFVDELDQSRIVKC